jgi:beta-N-acetylhexosaminidase
MIDNDLIGQHFIIDFDGPDITPGVERLIREGRIGGVILFAKNVRSPEQVRGLTRDLQGMASDAGLPSLFITIDQEGGIVNRITEGVTVFPGALAIGATGSEEYAAAAGRITSLELKALGINVNHAPVLDVNTNPLNPIIGIRAFGENPEDVARLGIAYLRAAQGAGMLATVKHFPGHGATPVDSHLDLPVVSKDPQQLGREEFLPFSRAFAAGAAGCMAAHIVFPALDPARPATLTPIILKDLLRHKLGFGGVLFTDSMSMKAIADRWPRGEAAVVALAAGMDFIMALGDEDEQWVSLHAALEALANGRLAQQQMHDSGLRIAQARARFVESPPLPETLDTAAFRRVAQQIADHAVTMVRTASGVVPLPAGKTAVVHVGQPDWLGETKVFVRLLSDYGVQAELTDDPEGSQWRNVVVASHSWRSDGATTVVPHLHARFGERLLVVGFGAPYELSNFPQVQTYLAAYGPDLPSITAAAKALTGAIKPSGRLPVSIPGLYPRGHRAP